MLSAGEEDGETRSVTRRSISNANIHQYYEYARPCRITYGIVGNNCNYLNVTVPYWTNPSSPVRRSLLLFELALWGLTSCFQHDRVNYIVF